MSDIQVVFSPRTPERKARLVMEALKTRAAKYTELMGASTNYRFAESRVTKDVVVLVGVSSATTKTLQDLERELREWRNKHLGGITLEVKRP